MKRDYSAFIASKSQMANMHGFRPVRIPSFLFPFQDHLVEWALRKGRGAIFADCGLGKGQPLDSFVLTPTGWRNIGNLIVGDKVIASDGKPYNVTGVYPKGEQDTYRVYFSDGCSFVVDDDHLHICRTNNDRQRGKPWRVMSTAELRGCGNIRYGKDDKSRNYDIPVVGDVAFEPAELPIKPYLLGVLLGDGHLKGNVSISSADDELLDRVRAELPEGVWLKHKSKYDWRIMTGETGNQKHPFRQSLKDLGLLGLLSDQKFVPREYLFASTIDRLALLRGLMDTDGYIDKGGTCQFYSISESLANAVVHLVRSLGGIPTRSIKETACNGKRCQPCHTVTFSLERYNPFFLNRKAMRWNSSPRDNGRWIDRIEFECRQPTVCISADSPDQSYVTENFIVTHNTPMQLAWADNVVRHTNRNVLVLTPLAVSQQLVMEGEKFGIEVGLSRDGKPHGKITALNYERLHKADEADYVAVVCDESSIMKHWSGKTQAAVTRFMSKMPYRLLCTATPAPNDFVELGTSSEALGYLTHSGMLETFFRQMSDDEKKRKSTSDSIIHSKRLSWRVIQSMGQWVLKAHAFEPFWKWVSSWARACRKPSDLGPYDDSRFILPPLNRIDHIVTPRKAPPGYLFTIPAFGLNQERGERRRTIPERTELVASLVNHKDLAVIWCQLNDEADAIEKAIPDAVQVKGSQSLEQKEELLTAFLRSEIRVLVTKAKIAGLGLNMQHCRHCLTFVDHSYEKFYQAIRRFWRFGQTQPVRLDVIATEGEIGVKRNMDRKQELADQMFESIVAFMNDSAQIGNAVATRQVIVPAWLTSPNGVV